MSPRLRRRLAGVLAVLCAAQALILALVLLRPAPELGPGDRGGAAAVPDLPDMPPLASFAETVARPLFLATRVDLPDGGKPAANRNLILGRYVFVGAVAAPGRSIVLLAPTGGGATVRVREGETLDGWTVREIGADFMRLERDGSESLVPLAKN
jgi:hypothetical protein